MNARYAHVSLISDIRYEKNLTRSDPDIWHLEPWVGKLGLRAEDDLQVCRYPIVFGRILTIDLTHH